MEIFKITDLSFTYPTGSRAALDRVSLTVEKGEFVTICGKSGCGKSTLLRHLKSCLTPYGSTTGEIFFDGRPLNQVDKRTQAASIGYVLQNPDNQIVTDKVWHELAFGLESLGLDNSTIRLRVAEMASFFGIQTWFMKDVSQLSGGQKQLLNLASIMAMQPKVLVLDEPTSQLDPIAAADFLETIRKINDDTGTTVILSEHRLEEAFPMSDRVIVMDHGRIISDGSPRQTGRKLAAAGHDMLLAMPAAVRISSEISPQEECGPLTVREGRRWLNSLTAGKEIACTAIGEETAPSVSDAVYELREVWFRYEREGEDIIRDLNLTVRKGSIHAIVGGNGTGKTTALSVMAGLNRPYRGKVKFLGRDMRQWKGRELFRNNLSFLPQNPQSLFVAMDVERDLHEMLSSLSRQERAAEVAKVAELMEIEDLLKMHPYDLSGGEQQRAALAKILLLKPKVILLDEPTKAIDSHFKQKLAHILRRLTSEGATVVLVSHDIEFCAEYADVCSLFFNGQTVAEGAPHQFFSGNSFYTTCANRMSRELFANAVTAKDVIELCRKNSI